MLVSSRVQALLTRERLLLSELLAFLETQGAPPEALTHVRQTITNLDESFLLVVVGEFNAGKSSFLNALLGSAVLPEGVTPTTDRIYVLTHGERGEPETTSDPFVVRLRVPLEALEGVALVDTPGTNAIIRQHQTLTEGFLPRADLVLFLTSADRPFTESERQFLDLARRWGRSVIMVVNKADLLETPETREQVRHFVEAGARGVLGLAPPVFLVSARGEQRGGDEGFRAFRAALSARLSETERTRLKLESPLAAAREILGGEERRAHAARETLRQDLETLRDLERQRERHRETMLGELDGQLNRVTRILSEFEARADKFIDDHLRISRFRELMNTRKLEERFREEAVRDLPEAIERQFATMIDRFVEANLHFWEDVQSFLIRRAPQQEVARTRFSYDRAALLEGIAGSAQRHLEDVTQQQLARELSQGAEDAMRGVLGAGGLGIGIGAVTMAVASTAFVDFTGVLAGLAIGGIGLFVLPAKRLQALRQLRTRVAQMREALEEIVRREYAREQERADARLADAMRPYTRFTELETARLAGAEERSVGLRAQIEALSGEVKALSA
ncbi:dynamin family protein [Deinococcus peraridilitoris]|uniref:Small GTP-binding protein domain protein n=1 Tax=Deinococcus peraridilitoris (strain DSM 19664 / LMG 22246 / CIP 109416 / KR-200) TaxID=937777 RepID=K9ZYF6_DEIPD|nr:dynamin family protein [Deinococcus peraridilitoris]AFZ66601.1 small GTP-binding protein domain protein [Deinococcus peraridilitoris DSM 19664]